MDGNKIVVGLTARGRDAGKVWFSLFHKLAYIVLGHIRPPNGTSEDDEKVADKWSGILQASKQKRELTNEKKRTNIIMFFSLS